MKPKEIKVNGITYVPKQEEHNQKLPLLNLLVVGDSDLKDVSVVANGSKSDILTAWACVSRTLLGDIDVGLSVAFKALTAAKFSLHNQSED